MTRCPNVFSSKKVIVIMLLSLVTLAGHASAQQASASQSADTLFADSKWEQAARAYADIAAKEPANATGLAKAGRVRSSIR